jgi:hypothetical protein
MAHTNATRFRKLRFSFSVACSFFCLLITVLWVRNFWCADVAWTPLPGSGQLTVASADGQMEFSISYPRTPLPKSIRQPATWGWQSYTSSRNHALDVVMPWKAVIRYGASRNGSLWLKLPHWFLVALPMLLATVPRIRWSQRFTIRTMLVVTALVAVILALTVTARD